MGSKWLERDFEPETAAKNKSGGYRLLILDGHNSHTTYRFCKFAEEHKIIVVCLPPHTTHRLQPLDVGIFGPLNSTWRAEVNRLSQEWQPIRKANLLLHYAKAREKAFTERTICSAFRKTGICPLNRNAIEEDAFAPALNTTTQAAQPIPAALPDLLVPVSEGSTESPTPSTSVLSSSVQSTSSSSRTSTSSTRSHPQNSDPEIQYVIKNMPRELSARATREDYAAQNAELRYLVDRCRFQMERDYAVKKLMDKENERLRKQLFEKSKKHSKKLTSGQARHMTAEENMVILAKEDWAAAMKEVFREPVFKARKAAYEDYCRAAMAEEKAREKEVERVRKDVERHRKEVEKRKVQEDKKRERERQKAMRDAAKLAKTAEAAAAKAAKQRLAASRKRVPRCRKQSPEVEDEVDSGLDSEEAENDVIEEVPVVAMRPRPRPRPRQIAQPTAAIPPPTPLRRSGRHRQLPIR